MFYYIIAIHTESLKHSGVSWDVGTRVWTSGQRVNLSDVSSAFIWRQVTAHEYKELPLHFTSWGPTEPNNNGKHEFCVAMDPSHNFNWIDVPCSDAYNAVCEIDIARS